MTEAETMTSTAATPEPAGAPADTLRDQMHALADTLGATLDVLGQTAELTETAAVHEKPLPQWVLLRLIRSIEADVKKAHQKLEQMCFSAAKAA